MRTLISFRAFAKKRKETKTEGEREKKYMRAKSIHTSLAFLVFRFFSLFFSKSSKIHEFGIVSVAANLTGSAI